MKGEHRTLNVELPTSNRREEAPHRGRCSSLVRYSALEVCICCGEAGECGVQEEFTAGRRAGWEQVTHLSYHLPLLFVLNCSAKPNSCLAIQFPVFEDAQQARCHICRMGHHLIHVNIFVSDPTSMRCDTPPVSSATNVWLVCLGIPARLRRLVAVGDAGTSTGLD